MLARHSSAVAVTEAEGPFRDHANFVLSNSVSIIDTSTNAVVVTVGVGARPVAVTPDGNLAYVANFFVNLSNASNTTLAKAHGVGTIISSPPSITATSGTPQSAPTNTAFANPLVATVKGAGGNPVATVTVTFAAPRRPWRVGLA